MQLLEKQLSKELRALYMNVPAYVENVYQLYSNGKWPNRTLHHENIPI